MNLKDEQKRRNQYLLEVYKIAKQEYPKSPTSVFFGLSRYQKYNLKTKEFINNDEEKFGYTLGEQMGLTPDEVDSIVIHFSNQSLGYMSSTLGLRQFNITQRGIMYLESLEEEPFVPIQIQNNNISVGDINAPTQFQQDSNNSRQIQEITYTREDITELFALLKSDIDKLNADTKKDFKSEMDYAARQLEKEKDIKTQLFNIGNLIRDVGINVFANLVASPIYESIKPVLGL